MTLQGTKFHLVESMDDANAFMSWLSNTTTSHLGWDTEGTGLDMQVDVPRTVQFGDESEGWTIPLDRWRGLAEEVFKRWDRRYVGWNVRFDVAMMRNIGIDVPTHLQDDGRFAAHIENPTESVALKRQAAKHVDPRAATMQEDLERTMHSGGWTWATIPIVATGPLSSYWVYAALDTVLTVRRWKQLEPTVRSTVRAYDTELAMGWMASRMESAGVKVDREYTMKQEVEFLGRYDNLTQRIHAEFGVDASSKQQIIQVFLRDGVDLWKRTPGGDYSLDKEVITGLTHPLAQLITERRKVEKLRSTYLRRFTEYSTRDGRIHARINTIGGSGKTVGESGGNSGVRTARMSLESPNLQQLPRSSDELSSVVRNCIVADEGKTLMMADFDQVELRIMGHLSRDPGLAEAFGLDEDFFVTLTREIYQDPTITKKDSRRNLTKSYTYATLYGAGNDKLATTTGVPLVDIERLSADFARAYSGVPTFQRAVQHRAIERARTENCDPYTRSPLTGRKFIGEAGKEYKLVNFTIQGMAAEILKTKILELDAAGLGDMLRLPVHDEVILEVDKADEKEVAQVLSEVMNDDNLLSIPLTAGLAHGDRWGSKVDYE